MADQTAAEPCTTWSGGSEAYDDDAINEVLLRERLGKPLIVATNLPECKSCARALAVIAGKE